MKNGKCVEKGASEMVGGGCGCECGERGTKERGLVFQV